jgi:hypothetical protein
MQTARVCVSGHHRWEKHKVAPLRKSPPCCSETPGAPGALNHGTFDCHAGVSEVLAAGHRLIGLSAALAAIGVSCEKVSR